MLLVILLIAAALRIRGIGFGLPALHDPDEPLFMMTALDMLRSHSLNPAWFGHPGTITFYCLALISLAVGASGVATGQYADAHAFVSAVYADPGILFLPARLFFAACGVACVYLTWRLGRRIGGVRAGLLGAAFLAVNALHVDYSQVIRTDIQASLFMLLCAGATLSIAERGRLRDYLLAGLFVGLGCATKWPAAAFAVGPIAVAIWRIAHGHADARKLLLFVAAAPAALLLASPYLLLDYPTVIGNLASEARPTHPGATGHGLVANLAWYVGDPLRGTFGIAGIALAALGTILIGIRNRRAAVALAPGIGACVLLLAVQALRWERWLIPLLPFAAIAAGYAVAALAEMARSRTGRPLALLEPLAGLLLVLPMLQATQVRAVTRANDTRQLASAWLRANAPPQSTILVEHAALDLLSEPWKPLFPLGKAGCVDARAVLAGRIRYSDAETLRSGSPVVDLGNVDPARLASCRARFLVLSHIDRYANDRVTYAAQWRRYAALTRGAVLRHRIAPIAERLGGPEILIFETPPAPPPLSSAR
ncbi:hypothetical protein FHS95_001702 [Sphingomonas naasensis]|nr:glycosyltransferase family 39 protein [Sphingomonas naasensis]NIJ20033.1 hypothetical protein [Sphingomonas naasensis]